MFFVKRTFVPAAALLTVLALSSCGSASDTNANQTNDAKPTTPAVTATAPARSTGTAISTATTTAMGTATTTAVTGAAVSEIKAGAITVSGKQATALMTDKGMTLYYFADDTATKAACTAASGCTTKWAPALYEGTGTIAPAAGTTVSGTLAVVKNENGNQITYNGHPLYTYSGDTATGQANGEGVGGKWMVATTDLTKLS